MIESIEYDISDSDFVSAIHFETMDERRRPGVLVFPTFKGPSELEAKKAAKLAALGYSAMVVDIYGGGRSTETPDEARAWMAELNGDRARLLRHAEAALAALKSHRAVDPARTAAIGFCFGGKCVLDLARAGADLTAIASFHGVYDRPPFDSDWEWKPATLILHGWEDPLATPAQTIDLAAELTARGADWQIVAYGHTGHAFTNPTANSPESGLFYDESTDRRSWSALSRFLDEVFA